MPSADVRIPGQPYAQLSAKELRWIRKQRRVRAKRMGYRYGFCACNCGRKTSIAKWTDRAGGFIRGEPNLYIQSHFGPTTSSKDWSKLRKKLLAFGGFCRCGCGQKTKVADHSDSAGGYIRGYPQLWLKGHGAADKKGPFYIVDKKTGCWVWQRATTKRGYGWAHFPGTGKTGPAHRVMWFKIKGEMPPSRLHLDHLCRNKLCVNPEHMEPVTATENAQRAVQSRSKRKKGHKYEIRRSSGRRSRRQES